MIKNGGNDASFFEKMGMNVGKFTLFELERKSELDGF